MMHFNQERTLVTFDLRTILYQITTLTDLADRIARQAGDNEEMRALAAEVQLSLRELCDELPHIQPRRDDLAMQSTRDKWVLLPESQLRPAGELAHSEN